MGVIWLLPLLSPPSFKAKSTREGVYGCNLPPKGLSKHGGLRGRGIICVRVVVGVLVYGRVENANKWQKRRNFSLLGKFQP